MHPQDTEKFQKSILTYKISWSDSCPSSSFQLLGLTYFQSPIFLSTSQHFYFLLVSVFKLGYSNVYMWGFIHLGMVIHHPTLKEEWLHILQQRLTCNGFSCWSRAKGFPAPLHHVKKNLALSCEDPCSSEFMYDITMCSEGSASQHDELSLLCVPSVMLLESWLR